MTDKVIYTHVSAKAVKGIERLAKDRDMRVFLSPESGDYTVVTSRAKSTRKAANGRFSTPEGAPA